MSSKQLMVTSVATAALVWPAAAPARPADPTPAPPSPPAMAAMAVSAADEYAQLRASSGGAVDLRSPDTRDQAADSARPVPETVRDDASAGGFDALSGALGLAAGVGLAIAAVALAGGLAERRLPRRDAARG